MNIVIPVGGKALRFYQAGYTEYKPFLPIGEKTMIEKVMDTVRPDQNHRFLLSIRAEDYDKFVSLKLEKTKLYIDQKQLGQAYGVMILEEIIDNDEELVIVNSDGFFNWDINDFIAKAREYDGSILVFKIEEKDPKWSYAKIEKDEVIRTVEKQAISDYATAGVYYWKQGKDFINASKQMLKERDHVNGEYYVCPVFNYLPRHKKIGFYQINKNKFYPVGTPEDYERYINDLHNN